MVRADLGISVWNELCQSLQDPSGSRTRQNTDKLLSNIQNEKKNEKENRRINQRGGGREREGGRERLKNETLFWDDLSKRMCVGVGEVRVN